MMRLDEQGRTLENALRLFHRDFSVEARMELLPPGWFDEIQTLLDLGAQKYDTPQLTESIVDGTPDIDI